MLSIRYLFLLFCCALQARHISIALIDTTLHSKESYTTLIRIGAALQMHFHLIYPGPHLADKIAAHDAYCLIVDRGITEHKDAYYTQLVKEGLAAAPAKPLFVLLSDQTIHQQPCVAEVNEGRQLNLDELSERIGAVIGYSDNETLDALDELMIKEQEWAPNYATSYQSAPEKLAPAVNIRIDGVSTLPRGNYPIAIASNLPLAFFIKPENKKPIIIGALTNFTFFDFDENARLNPLDPKIRRELCRAVIDTLGQIKAEITGECQELYHEAAERLVTEFGSYTQQPLFCPMYREKGARYHWTCNGIACGWYGVENKSPLLEKNLSLLAQSDLDAYWLELQMSLFEPDSQAVFYQLLDQTCAAFAAALASRHKAMPKFLLDTNLGALLKWAPLATHPVDIYGHEYAQVPAPLDKKQFWKPALLNAVAQIVKKWRDGMGHGLPLNGMVINFYQWAAKTEIPYYTNLLDFSDTAWNAFLATRPEQEKSEWKILTVSERIKVVLDRELLADYQFALEKEATKLGEEMATDIRALIPEAFIGAFLSVPLNTWFYRGILRGIANSHEPLLLFTNDVAFYAHRRWYEDNGIYALHCTCAPLAKFNNEREAELLSDLLRYHDGVWYSKVSRLGQEWESGKWWSNEGTNADVKKTISIMNRQIRK